MYRNQSLKNFLPFIVWVSLLITASGFAALHVQVKPHVYLGGGLGFTMGVKDQDFVIEDVYDQNYYTINYEVGKRSFTRGQMRMNFLEIDRFSVGYLFWSHYREYKTELSELWVKKGRSYPHSDDVNFHGITVQWDLRYPLISSRRFFPFLLVGAGSYYGSSKSLQYEFFDDSYYYYEKRFVTSDQKYSGKAWIYGGGFVFFRYGYLYIGVVDFGKQAIPLQRALDTVLGIRI